jgi:4-diphosphocytidyl-2-C-methyl-D-erythritol kinase
MRSEPKTQGLFHVASPAKVTLHLRILRRLRNGHHAVRILLAPVSVYDRLSFALGGPAGVSLTVQSPEPLGAVEDNLVLRAARAFASAAGRPLGAALRLEKHIPAGAGLGGGSGNAAATLLALNRWCGHPVGPQRMHALARALGADVPFFLAPRPAWAEGEGELLRPVAALPPLALLIVKPPVSIGTGGAYALARAEAAGGPAPAREPDLRSVAGVAAGLFNAFEPALFPAYPVLGQLKAALLGAGAQGALLSGSGSAVFGLFADAPARDAAAAALADRAGRERWGLLPCHTLRAHRYDLVF